MTLDSIPGCVHFYDIAGFKAVPVGGGWQIYSSKDRYVAYLNNVGDLFYIPKKDDGRIDFEASERTFNPNSELEQAVRYVYLIVQEPLE